VKLCGAGLHDLDDPAAAYISPLCGARICGPCRRAYDSARDPEIRRARTRAWYAANTERSLANDRANRAAHPEQHRANLRNHSARRRAAIGDDHVSAAEQAALLEASDGRCVYRIRCHGAPATELDHIVPLRPRAGEPAGRHVLENLAPACHECNCGAGGKHNLPLDIWLGPRRAPVITRLARVSVRARLLLERAA